MILVEEMSISSLIATEICYQKRFSLHPDTAAKILPVGKRSARLKDSVVSGKEEEVLSIEYDDEAVAFSQSTIANDNDNDNDTGYCLSRQGHRFLCH